MFFISLFLPSFSRESLLWPRRLRRFSHSPLYALLQDGDIFIFGGILTAIFFPTPDEQEGQGGAGGYTS